MRGRHFALAVGLAVAALALTGCGGDDDNAAATDTETVTETTETTEPAGETGTTLIGSVGPGFEISLTAEDGQAVSALAAGTYTIEVDDKSDIHNFHLRGADVDESTGVGDVEAVTWELELAPGSYTFVCDPHASTMSGSFDVSG